MQDRGEVVELYFNRQRLSQDFLKPMPKNSLASLRFITSQSLDLCASRVSGNSFKMRSASQVAPAL